MFREIVSARAVSIPADVGVVGRRCRAAGVAVLMGSCVGGVRSGPAVCGPGWGEPVGLARGGRPVHRCDPAICRTMGLCRRARR